jgi:hypothetical protein
MISNSKEGCTVAVVVGPRLLKITDWILAYAQLVKLLFFLSALLPNLVLNHFFEICG